MSFWNSNIFSVYIVYFKRIQSFLFNFWIFWIFVQILVDSQRFLVVLRGNGWLRRKKGLRITLRIKLRLNGGILRYFFEANFPIFVFGFKPERDRNMMSYEIGSLLKILDRIATFEIAVVLALFTDEERIIVLLRSFDYNLEFSKSFVRLYFDRKVAITQSC